MFIQAIRDYFTPSIAATFAANFIVSAWVYPYLQIDNDQLKLALMAIFLHILYVYNCKQTIIANARMETNLTHYINNYFTQFTKTHDIDSTKLFQNQADFDKAKRNILGRMEVFVYRLTNDITTVLTVGTQVAILSHYIRDAFGVFIISLFVIIYTANQADSSRFSAKQEAAKSEYLNARTKTELYHDTHLINDHLSRVSDAHYSVALKWKQHAFDRMFQRINVDIAVIVFVVYCIIASRIYNVNSGIVMITCANYLKNIDRIREFGRYYSELVLDFNAYTKICHEMLIPKVTQASSFDTIEIPIQQLDDIKGVTLSIDSHITINSGDVFIIDGPSGAGKTTFINMFTGMCASKMKVCIDGIGNISSSLRSLCNVFNNHIELVKNPTPKDVISCYGKFEGFVNKSAEIAGISEKTDMLKPCNTMSKGELQRVLIAEMVARLFGSKQKRIAVWDEMTDGIEETKALKTIETLISTFPQHVTIIVTHSSAIRNSLLEKHNSIKVLKVSSEGSITLN